MGEVEDAIKAARRKLSRNKKQNEYRQRLLESGRIRVHTYISDEASEIIHECRSIGLKTPDILNAAIMFWAKHNRLPFKWNEPRKHAPPPPPPPPVAPPTHSTNQDVDGLIQWITDMRGF